MLIKRLGSGFLGENIIIYIFHEVRVTKTTQLHRLYLPQFSNCVYVRVCFNVYCMTLFAFRSQDATSVPNTSKVSIISNPIPNLMFSVTKL